MSDVGTSPAPIPPEWRSVVAEILRAGGPEITTRQRADLEWEAMFPDSWSHERFDALADALDDVDLPGRKVLTMKEPGEVYEFLFEFRGRKVFAKINLLPGEKEIILYSSHRPNKGDHL